MAAGTPKARIAREYQCSRETLYKFLRQGEAIGKSN
ncbi:MAG: helix-turn-helix domain-containing protein [Desulfuromonadaceae bacterium]